MDCAFRIIWRKKKGSGSPSISRNVNDTITGQDAIKSAAVVSAESAIDRRWLLGS
jgi:hypothetical protein